MMTSRKLENFYLWRIKFLIFLIPFIPLYISPSMVFPYITGKNFAFRILVEMVAVLWLGLLALNKEYRLRNSAIVFSVLTFTLIVGLADLLGVNPYNSFWSNYERMEGYVTILHLTLYFMIVKSILKTRKDWMIFLSIFVVVSVVVSLYALIAPPTNTKITRYALEYGTRVSSTIGNPPFLASYLVLTVFLGLILIFNTQKPYLRYIYLLATLLNSTVIYLTATRGAILAAFTGIIFFGLFHVSGKTNSPKEKLFKKGVLSVLSIFIILSVVFWALSDNEFVRQDKTLSRFYVIFSDLSVKLRFQAWEMAWEGIKEKPILGWGQENFISVYSINPIPYSWTPWGWMDRAHNIVLDWLINAGFLGFFSYLMIFGFSFYVTRRAFHENIISRTGAIIVVTALVTYFVQNLFIFDTINTYIIFFTLLAYIDNLVFYKSPYPPFNNEGMGGFEKGENKGELLKRKGREYERKIASSKVNIDSKRPVVKSVGVTMIALLIFSVTAYYINYRPIRESQLSNQINLSLPKYKSFSNLLDDINDALSFQTFGDTDIRLKMYNLSRHILGHKLFMHEGALKFIQATAEELEKLVTANRNNLEYWYYLIILYNKIAFYEPSYISKAEALIRECMRLNPDFLLLNSALADNYILKKDYENAFIIAKKAVALDPLHDAVYIKLALAGILTFRDETVNKALEDVKRIRESKHDNIASGRAPLFSFDELLDFAQTSVEIKNFNWALKFYKEMIAISPERPGPHFEIAKIYLNLNDEVNAIREAKKAAELDPLNYAEHAKKFINSLKR